MNPRSLPRESVHGMSPPKKGWRLMLEQRETKLERGARWRRRPALTRSAWSAALSFPALPARLPPRVGGSPARKSGLPLPEVGQPAREEALTGGEVGETAEISAKIRDLRARCKLARAGGVIASLSPQRWPTMSSPRIPDLPHPAQAARLLGLMLGLLVLPGCPFGPGEPPVLLPRQVDSAAEVALHLGAYRDFATRLYRHQAARQSDFVVAPLPIWLALSIAVEPSLLLSEERRTVASGPGLIDPVAPFAAHAPEGRYVGNGWFTQRPHEPLGYHGPAVTTDIYPDGFREPYSGEAEQKKTVELHERVTAWLSGSAKQGLLSSVISADDFRGSTLLSAWAMRAARACSLGGEASGPSTSTPKEPVVTLARSFSLVHGVLYELSPPGWERPRCHFLR